MASWSRFFLAPVWMMLAVSAAIPVCGHAQETTAEPPNDTAASAVSADSAYAQDPARGERDWRLIVAPYVWAAGMEGDSTLNDVTTHVDVGFSDILDHLDYGFIGHAEIHWKRWFLFSDTNILQMSADVDMSRDSVRTLQRQGRLPGYIDPPVSLPTATRTIATAADVEAEMTMWSLIQEIMAGYRVYEHVYDDGDEAGRTRRLGFDVYGGIRYYEFRTELDVDVELTGTFSGPLVTRSRTVKKSVSIDETVSWIDPVVGGRISYDMLRNLSLMLQGDVGGFGVGSDFAWSAMGLAQWRLNKNFSLIGGYKILEFDYEDGDDAMDMTLQGPVATLMYEVEF